MQIRFSSGLGGSDTRLTIFASAKSHLSDETLAAYKNYVYHEEKIREQIRAWLAMGRSLRDWRRAFFLSSELRPTRHEVIEPRLRPRQLCERLV